MVGPGRRGRADRVGIEAGAVAHPAGARAAVAQVKGDGAWRLPGQDPDGRLQLAAAVANLDHLLRLHAELRRRRRAEQRRVVPRELGVRLRKFLEPAVVGEPAVVDRRVGAKHDLEALARGADGAGVHGAGGQRLLGCRRAGHEPVVQRLAPELVEGRGVLQAAALLPVGAEDVGARLPRLLGHERADHLVGRPSAVERRDQRLNDGDDAVGRARVAPRFQVVRGRDVPLAERRGLVPVQAVMDRQPHLPGRQEFAELQIRGSRVDRVALEDDQRIDLAGLHVGGQRAERRQLVGRLGLDRFGDDHRLADVAERLVDRVNQRVHRRRLFVARDDQARAPVLPGGPLRVARPTRRRRDRRCPPARRPRRRQRRPPAQTGRPSPTAAAVGGRRPSRSW